MENIQQHTIQFAESNDVKSNDNFESAEGLNSTATKVDVLDSKKPSVKKRANDLQPPWSVAKPSDRQINWTLNHNKKIDEVRLDRGYQFIMKVAGFTNRNMKTMMTVPGSSGSRNAIPEPLTNAYTGPVPPEDDEAEENWSRSHDQYKWMSVPEISGVVHLSSILYGHIKEAQDILERKMGQRFVLKGLVEGNVSTLFARLVGIRIHLSQFLSGVNYQLDRTYKRLHREQHMILRAFQCELGHRIQRDVSYNTWLRDRSIYNIGQLNGNNVLMKNRFRGLY